MHPLPFHQLLPSRSGFRRAYRALRLERRYVAECSLLGEFYEKQDPLVFAGLTNSFGFQLGNRSKEHFSPELYRAALRAMLDAHRAAPRTVPQKLAAKRKREQDR